MTDLGTLGGTYSLANGVNNGGQVVGEAEDGDYIVHAFLWQNGAMVDLNTLLPANSEWELTTALQINNAGQIAGFGFYQHQYVPYLMTIVPPVVNHPPVANAGVDQVIECTGAQTLAPLKG